MNLMDAGEIISPLFPMSSTVNAFWHQGRGRGPVSGRGIVRGSACCVSEACSEGSAGFRLAGS